MKSSGTVFSDALTSLHEWIAVADKLNGTLCFDKSPWKELMIGVTRPFFTHTLPKKDKGHDSSNVSFSLFTNLTFFCFFVPMGLENQKIE